MNGITINLAVSPIKSNYAPNQRFIMVDFDDPGLLQAFGEGDNRAFNEIYKRYYPSLFANCLNIIRRKGSSEDAKDLVLVTFQKLYERRDKITTASGIRHFLYLAVRTGCIDFLRRKGRVKETPHDLEGLDARNDEIDAGFWESVRQEKLVMEKVAALPIRSKRVIELFYLHGLKYKEIAEQLNIPTKTVENDLRYALKKLRSALVESKIGSVLVLATTLAGVFRP